MDWKEIATAVLPNLWIVLIPLAAAFLREQIAKVHDDRLRSLLLEWVKAAEQMYGSGAGQQKKSYVEAQATNAGLSVSETAIEAAVHTLKTMGASS